MKKNLYYRTLFRRENAIKGMIFDLFYSLASYPRLLLEVFIRRNMGERYFSFSTAIIMIVFLAAAPVAMGAAWGDYGFSMKNFLLKNITWYIFLAGFFYVCLRRRNEIKRLPSVFDFARFSLSTGEIHPLFHGIYINGKPVNVRSIETIYEPAFFLVIGIFLAAMSQLVGFLLVICSIVYSLSYMAAYSRGDNFVMDKIDEMICNQELYNSFVDGVDPSNTRGVNYYGRRPADEESRRRVADMFTDEGETVEAL